MIGSKPSRVSQVNASGVIASRLVSRPLIMTIAWTSLGLVFALISPSCLYADDAESNPQPNTPEFLKPLVNQELSFIKRVCQLSPEQMHALAQSAEKAFEKMSELLDKDNRKPGQPYFYGPGDEILIENPIRRVRHDALRYARQHLSEQHFKQYQSESELRHQFERETAIDVAVEVIDHHVHLDLAQRAIVRQQLLRDWLTADIWQMEHYLGIDHVLPMIPDHVLSPVLTPAQRRMWKSKLKARMQTKLSEETLKGWGEQWLN